MADRPQVNEPQTYTRTAVVMHWMIGVLLIAEVAFGFLLDTIAPRGTPARAATINLHKSFGVLLLVLIVARIWWRLRHRPPAWPAFMPNWQRAAAEWVHRTMYACMLVAPLAGYIASNFSKHGLMILGTRIPPWGPDLPKVYELLNRLHDIAAYILAVLVVGHVLIALKHAWVDRDAMIARMWKAAPH